MSIDSQERDLFAVWDRVFAREREVGFASLDHPSRVFLAIWELEAELNNGGFSQWMFNSAGDHAEFAVAALREVGASDAAAACERFFALMPGGRPSPDRDTRQQQLDAASEAAGEDAFEDACSALEQEFYALEDDLRNRLYTHARSTLSI